MLTIAQTQAQLRRCRSQRHSGLPLCIAVKSELQPYHSHHPSCRLQPASWQQSLSTNGQAQHQLCPDPRHQLQQRVPGLLGQEVSRRYRQHRPEQGVRETGDQDPHSEGYGGRPGQREEGLGRRRRLGGDCWGWLNGVDMRLIADEAQKEAP